jgi:hypothetical protein
VTLNSGTPSGIGIGEGTGVGVIVGVAVGVEVVVGVGVSVAVGVEVVVAVGVSVAVLVGSGVAVMILVVTTATCGSGVGVCAQATSKRKRITNMMCFIAGGLLCECKAIALNTKPLRRAAGNNIRFGSHRPTAACPQSVS